MTDKVFCINCKHCDRQHYREFSPSWQCGHPNLRKLNVVTGTYDLTGALCSEVNWDANCRLYEKSSFNYHYTVTLTGTLLLLLIYGVLHLFLG